MNPTTIYRYVCEQPQGGRTCGAILDIPLDSAASSALAKGWSFDGNFWRCDTCSAVLKLCPVCKSVKFRWGYDGTCSRMCAGRKIEVAVNDETEAILLALVKGLDK